MNNRDKLSDEDLTQVNGGTFDTDAQAWITRNKATVYERAGASNASKLDFVFNYASRSKTVYTVDAIKQFLSSYNLDVSDLD